MPPFAQVRALTTSELPEVEAYLDGFIPPHCRRPAPPPPPPPPPQQQQQQQDAQQQQLLLQRQSSSAGSQAVAQPVLPLVAGAVPAQQVQGAAMQQYAAGLQPAGFKRPRGRPRIHPIGSKGKKGRPAQAAAAAAAAAAAPSAAAQGGPAAAALRAGMLTAAAAAAGAALASPAGDPADPSPALAEVEDAGGAEAKPQRRRGPRPLAEATYIASEERRQQVGARRRLLRLM